MPAAAEPATASPLTINADPDSEQPAPMTVREAFARAAPEMHVSVGQLERFLPEWAERLNERVDYQQFHQHIRLRIVEVLRADR